MSPEQLTGILPLFLIVAVFWLLVIRPARKKQRETSRIQANVDVGAEVMLGSGLFGTVLTTADETIQLEVAPGTAIKVARQAVVRVVEPAISERDDERNARHDENGGSSANAVDEQ